MKVFTSTNLEPISRQLYKKYNLTAEEIEFVENNLPPQS